MADECTLLLHNLIASQLLAGGMHSLAKNLMKSTELPAPSNWLLHLINVGRDVLGITGFNFQENPVIPHTSFVNSLQEAPNYYPPPSSDYLQLTGEFDIAELESPIKHYLQADDPPSLSQNLNSSNCQTDRQINFPNSMGKMYPPPVYGKGFWSNPGKMVPGPGKMVPGPGKLMPYNMDYSAPSYNMGYCGPGKGGQLYYNGPGKGGKLGKLMPELADHDPQYMAEEPESQHNEDDENTAIRIKNVHSKKTCQKAPLNQEDQEPLDESEASQEQVDSLDDKMTIVDTKIQEKIDKINSTKSLISDLTRDSDINDIEDLNQSTEDIIADEVNSIAAETSACESNNASKLIVKDVEGLYLDVEQGETIITGSEELTPARPSEELTPLRLEELSPLESASEQTTPLSLRGDTSLMLQIQNLQNLLTNSTPTKKGKEKGKDKGKEPTRKRARKKKSTAPEETAQAASTDRPSDDTGETELLTELQRLLTSNIMSTSTPKPVTKGAKAAKKRGRPSKNPEPTQDPPPLTLLPSSNPLLPPPHLLSEGLAGPATSSKLFTELHRLLTQNSIRSAIQDDKQNRIRDLSTSRVSHPTSSSPPYIQAPQAFDQSSQDASNLTELFKARHDGDKKTFICPQCNKEFKTQQCLKRHVGRHLGVKPYPCLYCQKRFNDKANMHRHEKTHLNERNFVCDVCDEKFFRKEVLQMHVRTKHAIASDIVTCKFKNCSFVCKVPSVLVEHIQTQHFNNYRYTCETCDYKTSFSSNYKAHCKVHTGERPHKCKTCGKGFKQANALKVHNKTHQHEHCCAICLKTFALQLGLKRHYEYNHGPNAAQNEKKKAFEKHKKEIVKKYREQRNVHSKKLSFVNVMPTKL